MSKLEIKTKIQIAESREEVFQAIINPEKMSNYFISESSGKMVEGESLNWKFPEFEDSVPVKVVKVIPPEFISFDWEGAKGKKLLVEITLIEVEGSQTVVKITEGKMENDDAGITWYGGNTEGWANFLACLKAYLEHGINLRKGAFDFMKTGN